MTRTIPVPPFLRPTLAGVVSRLALVAVLVSGGGCSLVVDTSGRAAAVGEPLCTSNTECGERLGETSACVQSRCVPLLTEECTEVVPAGILEEDNLILFGYLGDLAAGLDAYGTPTKEGAELALIEIEAYNGIPGVSGQAQRHVGMLVCDHGREPVKVAKHLAEDVKVPAIIGASFSGVTLEIFDKVGLPTQTLVLSPSATSPAITEQPNDRGLLWRTAPSDIVQTEALKLLTIEVVKALHASGRLEAGEKPRIAVPYKGDAAGRGLYDAIKAKLTSPNAAEPVEPGFQDLYEEDPTSVDWPVHIDKLLAYQPDIIIPLGTNEFVDFMMPEIEARWNTGNKPRPWYLLPEGDRAPQLLALANDHEEWKLDARAIGTAPGARKSDLYEQFEGSFESVFDQRQPGNLAEFGYDAAYLLIYAIALADKAFPTGLELANALKLVNCDGNSVPAGRRDSFVSDFTDAAQSQCIDFEGASGPLEFDPKTGEAFSDIAIWCLRQTDGGEVTYNPPIDSYYSVESGAVAWETDGNEPIDFTTTDWCPPAPQ